MENMVLRVSRPSARNSQDIIVGNSSNLILGDFDYMETDLSIAICANNSSDATPMNCEKFEL